MPEAPGRGSSLSTPNRPGFQQRNRVKPDHVRGCAESSGEQEQRQPHEHFLFKLPTGRTVDNLG
jgi:hypothetical protein